MISSEKQVEFECPDEEYVQVGMFTPSFNTFYININIDPMLCVDEEHSIMI